MRIYQGMEVHAKTRSTVHAKTRSTPNKLNNSPLNHLKISEKNLAFLAFSKGIEAN